MVTSWWGRSIHQPASISCWWHEYALPSLQGRCSTKTWSTGWVLNIIYNLYIYICIMYTLASFHRSSTATALTSFSWTNCRWTTWSRQGCQVFSCQNSPTKTMRNMCLYIIYIYTHYIYKHIIYIYTLYIIIILYPALSQYSKFSLDIYLANWAGHTHVTNNWLMLVGG